MTSYTTLVSAAVYLALNLTIFGTVIAMAVATAFRLLPANLPRLRYLVAVATFCAASTLPILATLGLTAGSKSLSPPAIEARISGLTADNAPSTEAGAGSGQAPPSDLVTRVAQRLARSSMAPVFFWLWLAVSTLLTLRELIGHVRLLRARREWRHAPDALRLALNWPDRIPLYLDHRAGPSAVGWLCPVVALPSWLFDELSPATTQRIALHELAHARWRDPLVNALMRLALALLWPGLPLWFLERLALVEREAAADQAALAGARLGAEMKQAALDYADSLVSIAGMEKMGAGSRSFSPVAAHAGGRRSLEIRVSLLLQEAPRGAPVRLALGLAALFGGLAGASWLPAAGADHGQESDALPRRVIFHPSGGATLIRQTGEGEVQEPILRRSEAELKASAVEQVNPSPPEELPNNPGAVMVSVLIDEYGEVISARAIAGSRNQLVEQKAVEAARRWRFTPATMEGRPAKVIGELTFFGQVNQSKQWIEIR
ncbi:MAG: TonB family protein [Blastocatellia bacterium]